MMSGGAKLRIAGGTPSFGLLALLLVLAASVLAPSPADAAPYEPNDAIPAASGPLIAGQTLTAALESSTDRDFFFFYVTSPAGAAVELTVQNLGGDSNSSDVDATILDGTATPVVAQSFIRDGESRLLTAQLEPQKYFVEVTTNEGFGDSYSLAPGGGAGAFGPFSQISTRCERARAADEKAEHALRRAKSKLQRATGRLRRSRYSPPEARLAARRAHAAAKRNVRAKRSALRAARSSMQPWCSIAP